MNQIDRKLSKEADIWAADRLGFADIGQSFTNIIQTIDDSKVISIEAPFGYGKTFFRERWTKQLKAAGELVIEIDALQSDHSGDPLVTFVGALVQAKPKNEKTLLENLGKKSLDFGGMIGRGLLRAAFRQGAEEVIDAAEDAVKSLAPEVAEFQNAIDEVKSELSKAAGQMIATHLAAEQARKIELPAQIDALRDALTEGSKNKRIVIIVDELDRCHPEYAISLLEAMKLVFGRDGFVFVLMVNPNYLEDVAKHRFGFKAEDELYLSKFIDMRFKLSLGESGLSNLAAELLSRVNLALPFGDEAIFGLTPAVELIKRLVTLGPISARELERTVARIDLVTRCYLNKPIDLPLLTFLAMQTAFGARSKLSVKELPRAILTPSYGIEALKRAQEEYEKTRDHDVGFAACPDLFKSARELLEIPRASYGLPEGDDSNYYDWHMAINYLAPHYIPSHQAMLDGVMRFQAD